MEHKMTTIDEFLSLKDAAQYLKVSDIKIRRLISKGLLTIALDPLDDRKRLVKKTDLDNLKTPRSIKHIMVGHQDDHVNSVTKMKKDALNTDNGSVSNES
jgi:excisionase family DNA binding protein